MKSYISRRSFIRLSTAVTLSQLLASCGSSNINSQILFLENSIPLQLIGDFKKTVNTKAKLDFKAQTQLTQIFDSLFDWQSADKSNKKDKSLFDKIFNKSVAYPHSITLGDAWLSLAIKQKLIQPLSVKDLANWQKLPSTWQQIVTRDKTGKPSATGEVWGAPYRWGSTVIAYQSKKLAQLGIEVEDWQDLWQPQLRDRISLLDSPREIIGLTLKKLGKSYNTEDLESVPELKTELSRLHQQTKLYSSKRYLESLILEDTWAAVGWSTDVIPLLKRYPDIKFVVPTSGTSLWADLWVKPKLANPELENKEANNQISNEWIDFCWQPKAIKQISLFTDGLSPILSSLKSSELPADLQDNPLIDLEISSSEQNEFLLPLSPETEKQYRDLWLKTRKGVLEG